MSNKEQRYVTLTNLGYKILDRTDECIRVWLEPDIYIKISEDNVELEFFNAVCFSSSKLRSYYNQMNAIKNELCVFAANRS